MKQYNMISDNTWCIMIRLNKAAETTKTDEHM